MEETVTGSQVFYLVFCIAFPCLLVSLLSRKSYSFFTAKAVRFVLIVALLACCWGWAIDLLAMRNMPLVKAASSACEDQAELLTFKKDYAKLQRDVYLKFINVVCILACVLIAQREADVQQELTYYRMSLQEMEAQSHRKEE